MRNVSPFVIRRKNKKREFMPIINSGIRRCIAVIYEHHHNNVVLTDRKPNHIADNFRY